jgi:hypothetical protein
MSVSYSFLGKILKFFENMSFLRTWDIIGLYFDKDKK